MMPIVCINNGYFKESKIVFKMTLFFLKTTEFLTCSMSYFLVLISSALLYNVENNQEHAGVSKPLTGTYRTYSKPAMSTSPKMKKMSHYTKNPVQN